MLESIITISFLGLFAGFFFSMPVAGPISIVVVSNALKGNLRFCLRTALGASIAESFYVFAAISGKLFVLSLTSKGKLDTFYNNNQTLF